MPIQYLYSTSLSKCMIGDTGETSSLSNKDERERNVFLCLCTVLHCIALHCIVLYCISRDYEFESLRMNLRRRKYKYYSCGWQSALIDCISHWWKLTSPLQTDTHCCKFCFIKNPCPQRRGRKPKNSLEFF
jgi:hypothetical protein